MKNTFGVIALSAALAWAPVVARADDEETDGEQVQADVESPPPSPPPDAQLDNPVYPADAVDGSTDGATTQGQWVNTEQYGWVWMPYASDYTYLPADGGAPSMYVYYPTVGWSWVVAPWIWGWGPSPYFGAYGYAHFGWYGNGYGRWGGFRGRWADYDDRGIWNGTHWAPARPPPPSRMGAAYARPAAPWRGRPAAPSWNGRAAAPWTGRTAAPWTGRGYAPSRPVYNTAAPRGGSWSAPRGGSFSAPRGGSWSAPRGGSFSAPRGGGWSAPRGGSSSAPRGGGFRGGGAPRVEARGGFGHGGGRR